MERGDRCAIRFEWLRAKHEEPALLVDVCFAWVVNVGRRGTGLPIHPVHVGLDRSPAHRRMYEARFRCPVTFEARRNVVVFDRADLDRPFRTHNPDLLAVVAPQLESELARKAEETSLSEQVKGALKRQLAGQRPELRRVARELGLSTRTLQRRLMEQAITFQQLLEQARREMARH